MYKARRIAYYLFFLLFFSQLTWAKNQVNSVRIWPSPSNTRVVLDLKQEPQYSYFSLKNPERLVVDIKDAGRKFDFKKLKNSSKLIKGLRYSKAKSKNAIRIVFDLPKSLNKQVFALSPTAPYGHRLVIDFQDPNPVKTAKPVIKTTTPNSQRDIVVAIVAGHGGEDPGSIGFSGSYEKHVTLSIARKLAKKVNNEKGMRAVMIRNGDYYVPLNRRTAIARQKKADVLISIHADAFRTPQPSGASVWVLSVRRANTELGRWMEKREKHSELLGGAAEIIQDTANERYLTQALLDMSMDHSIASSYDLSKEVIKQLKKVTKMHKKTPQAASFAVLTAPDIPSILVETGFISNKQEEKNLNWDKHRQRLADSIFNALKAYFRNTPPDGTLWAKWRQQNRTHKVKRGESLSLLAQRYNVSVTKIKSANKLKSNVVRIGQVLTIPSS